MALADLLLKMEGRATDTPDTPCNPPEVSAKPLQDKACTLDTPDTRGRGRGKSLTASIQDTGRYQFLP
jgi:hypothetical protein